MHVNRTGAGFHRDSRREARLPRKAEREWAIGEQTPSCDGDSCEECVIALCCRHED